MSKLLFAEECKYGCLDELCLIWLYRPSKYCFGQAPSFVNYRLNEKRHSKVHDARPVLLIQFERNKQSNLKCF